MNGFEDKIEVQNLSGRLKRCVELVDPKDKEILDVGCSFGWYEKYAVLKGCKKIVGLDPDLGKLELARQEVPEATFIHTDTSAFPLQDQSFDLVTMFDVLEHLPAGTETTTLKEVYQVLRSQGTLVLSTPLSTFCSNLLDPAWYLGHRHYRESILLKLTEGVGFKIQRVEYGGGIFDELSLLVFYFYKWILRRRLPSLPWLVQRVEKEWKNHQKGSMSIFVVARKT